MIGTVIVTPGLPRMQDKVRGMPRAGGRWYPAGKLIRKWTLLFPAKHFGGFGFETERGGRRTHFARQAMHLLSSFPESAFFRRRIWSRAGFGPARRGTIKGEQNQASFSILALAGLIQGFRMDIINLNTLRGLSYLRGSPGDLSVPVRLFQG